MRQCPKIYKLLELTNEVNTTSVFRRVKAGRSSHTTIPARPINYSSIPLRFKAAWLVFTGKADAVQWPEDTMNGVVPE
jgi:hypothetical protein